MLVVKGLRECIHSLYATVVLQVVLDEVAAAFYLALLHSEGCKWRSVIKDMRQLVNCG